MAGIKISDFTPITGLTGSEIIPLVQEGTNKSVTVLDIIKKGNLVEVTYDELFSLMLAENLIPGQFYRITDFQTVYWLCDRSGDYILDDGEKIIIEGDIEPLIILATSHYSLSLDAYVESNLGDRIKYMLFADSDVYKIPQFTDANNSYANPTGFRGIITYREDTINNIKAPFDWRNIIFRKWTVEQEEWSEEAEYTVSSVVQVSNLIYKAKEYSGGSDPGPITPGETEGWEDYWTLIYELPANAYLAYSFTETQLGYYLVTPIYPDEYVYTPMFGEDCHDIFIPESIDFVFITIGDTCGNIDFSLNTSAVSIEPNCNFLKFNGGIDIIIAAGCGLLEFGIGCTYISIRTTSFYLSFLAGCRYITLGSKCSNITFGSGCNLLFIGDNCVGITFGSTCSVISMGDGCTRMSFGSDCGEIVIPEDACDNDFKAGVKVVSFDDADVLTGITVTHQMGYNGVSSEVVQSYLEYNTDHYDMVYTTNKIGTKIIV